MMVQMVFFCACLFQRKHFCHGIWFHCSRRQFYQREETFAFHLSCGFHAIQHFISLNIKCNETSLFIYFAICELCYFSFFKQTRKKYAARLLVFIQFALQLRLNAFRFDACMDRLSMQSNNLKYLDQFFIRENLNKCPKRKINSKKEGIQAN